MVRVSLFARLLGPFFVNFHNEGRVSNSDNVVGLISNGVLCRKDELIIGESLNA